MKEFEEGFAQWLRERGWSLSINWSDAEHKACTHNPHGNWKLKGYGYYQAADWQHRYYASMRCTKCGMMVQFNQIATDENQDAQPVQRLVVVP
jgi:hypothetical protein